MESMLEMPPLRPTVGSQFRTLSPLYVMGLIVTLCGIGAVNNTVEDPAVATATVALTILGFIVSFTLRLARVDPNHALYPALGIGLFVVAQRYWRSAIPRRGTSSRRSEGRDRGPGSRTSPWRRFSHGSSSS
jgi:hypothetical protein